MQTRCRDTYSPALPLNENCFPLKAINGKAIRERVMVKAACTRVRSTESTSMNEKELRRILKSVISDIEFDAVCRGTMMTTDRTRNPKKGFHH
jgi:hypothetical protein